jgi:lipopolysaccharide assembly protein A
MLRLIITLPFLIALVVFVLYNQTSQPMSVPDYSWQSSVGVVALVTAVVFFLLGALFVWFAELRQRRRARRAEAQVRTLETQNNDLRTQLAQAAAQNAAYQAAHQSAPPGTIPGTVSVVPPSSAHY